MKRDVYIIAEAGVNHNGNVEIAKKLVDAAVAAKADAVKFQTFSTEKTIKKDAIMAKYQIENIKQKTTQFEMLKKLELSYKEFKELKEYCESKSIEFLSTPFDLDSVDFLDSIGVNFFKVGSGEIINYPLLKKVVEKGKPVILSTGMSTLGEIEGAVNFLQSNGVVELKLMHCTSNYPPKTENINLNAITTLQKAFGLEVGYSDHSLGIYMPIAAVALGATVIEKHLTLDNNMEGPDHIASLNPNEFKEMVKNIRKLEVALGDGIKRVTDEEVEVRLMARKSIVAASDLTAGTLISQSDITYKRPGSGILPMFENLILGKRILRDYKKDEIINIWDISEI